MLRPILGQSLSPPKQIKISSCENDNSASTSTSITECAYCRSNGYDASGHTKVKCPRLALLSPCVSCGASGINNHTASHCPLKPRTVLRLKQPPNSL